MLKTLESITRQCLFSPTCLLCSHHCQQPLCHACLALLPYIDHACPRCAIPLPDASSRLCARCLQMPPPFQRTVASFHYQLPIQTMLLELKFDQGMYWLPILTEKMATIIKSAYQKCRMPDVLVPVPLHPHRLRERGYNQALEMAKLLSKHVNIPRASNCCRRITNTLAQSDLPAKQRRANMRQAFEVTATAPQSIAIIDDIMTTGHTVAALAAQFSHAGTKEIHVWCCARA